MRYKHKVKWEIALTHLLSRKTQTLIAALGVMFGAGIFIFMNSLFKGFEDYSNETLFNSVPHLRVYREEAVSQPILGSKEGKTMVLSNPKISENSGEILNPSMVMSRLKSLPYVTGVSPNASVSVFFKNGSAQVSGIVSGIDAKAHDALFSLSSNIVAGDLLAIESTQNGLVLSVGIAEKLNIRLEDNISVTSSVGVSRIMKVVTLLETGNRSTDGSLAYASLSQAQQLLKKGTGYISDINVNIHDYEMAKDKVQEMTFLTGYQVEDWETANSSAAAANTIRAAMGLAISFSILLVAGFGIYNILNMTIMQKINDIAILKAIGFSGRDVITIFLSQALLMGAIGVVMGIGMAIVLIEVLGNLWVGGNIGYFPIDYYIVYFITGAIFGLIVVFFSGFIPSRKAAKVDPVEIFRG